MAIDGVKTRHGAKDDFNENRQKEDYSDDLPNASTDLGRPRSLGRGPRRKLQLKILEKGAQRNQSLLHKPFKDVSSLQQTIEPGSRRVSGFGELDLELIGPDEQRPPYQLIRRNDDGQHGNDTPERTPVVPLAYGCRHVRTQAGQLNIFS